MLEVPNMQRLRQRRRLELRAALKRRGISQYELAKRLGVTRQAVSLWISGRRRMPEVMALRIAEIVGLQRGNLRIETR